MGVSNSSFFHHLPFAAWSIGIGKGETNGHILPGVSSMPVLRRLVFDGRAIFARAQVGRHPGQRKRQVLKVSPIRGQLMSRFRTVIPLIAPISSLPFASLRIRPFHSHIHPCLAAFP